MNDGDTLPGGAPPSARIWVSRVATRGFRRIDGLSVDLERGTTFLVGENNTGKTSLLAAISAAVGRYRPTNDDLTRRADGSSADRAEIDLIIRPADEDTFGPHERGVFGGNAHRLPGDPVEFVGIRATFSPSREGGQLISHRVFLQPGRAGLVVSPASVSTTGSSCWVGS